MTLIDQLKRGCIMRPRRSSGDTHTEFGGSVDEEATNELMEDAARRIEILHEGLAREIYHACVWRESLNRTQDRLAKAMKRVEQLESAIAGGLCNFTQPCGNCERCIATAYLFKPETEDDDEA